MHGAAGILTVLLQAPAEVIEPFMPEILATTTALCRLTLENHGHLSSSLPVTDRSDAYVQICHGSPGLIILLTALKLLFPAHWGEDTVYADTLPVAADAVWEQGLLKKGLSICHGVSGNAWPLLLLAQVSSGEERDKWLGRALSLLMEARKMPPMGTGPFMMPDAPLSLFQGVAGMIAACAEACAVVEGDEDRILGFVGLGGRGVTGFF
jgi:hypothetical protein